MGKAGVSNLKFQVADPGISDYRSDPPLTVSCFLRPKSASIFGLAYGGGCCLFLVLALILIFAAVPAHAASSVDSVFGKIDLAFERNEGQVNPRVKFFTRTPGYSLFLTSDE